MRPLFRVALHERLERQRLERLHLRLQDVLALKLVGALAAWNNHPFTVCDGHTVRRAGGETRIDMSSYLIALTHEEHTPRPEGTSNRYKRPKACLRTAQRYGSTPLVCCCLPITDAHENNMRHANALLQKCEKAGSVFVQHFSQDKRSTARSTSTQQMSFRQR